MVNSFYIIGNLVKDVEQVEGQNFISGTIAQNYKKKNGEDATTYLPFVYFGNGKDNFLKHGKKGNQIYVEGVISSYKNKDSHTVLSLNVQRYQITNFRNEQKNDAQSENNNTNYGF